MCEALMAISQQNTNGLKKRDMVIWKTQARLVAALVILPQPKLMTP